MKYIKDKAFPNERALYGEKDVTLDNCRFEGEEDGESALKETKNVIILNSFIDLRYPLWHVEKLYMENVTQTENCRASLWYSSNIRIHKCSLLGIKALTTCFTTGILYTFSCQGCSLFEEPACTPPLSFNFLVIM